MNIFIKPARDAAGNPVVVRDPLAKWEILKPEGEWKHPTPYWLRRVRDGDVFETTPPAPAVPVKNPAKSTPAKS